MLSHACLLVAVSIAAPPQSAFRENVRTTGPLTAQQQAKTFHLPEGFRMELVAAEPQIYKPMNLAFDAAGRLWVSESVEYPYAAKEGEGRDRIQILEDTDGDGRYDKTTTFVDGLNIPIGLLPYGEGVIAYSIPNICYFRDTDGDGKCDKREVLYGPLGTPRDTHGMQNAFRRGFDGWIYVCHGFANTSTITGKDGSSITMQSGNTYRIRPDGSRVEQFTWGQVNPFGSTFTPWGDLITADCHSKPLTLLLRGGYYSSFGKPHDGIGFVPPMMEHLHGSTAIAGAAHYSGGQFPAEYHGRLFVGNVVTSRVNCDVLQWKGATAKAVEQEDFVRSDDPWFRPVDVRIGPDGALYIADFYNRIIGHYEVPLDHPGRDRHRGRIWRVVNNTDAKAPPRAPDLTGAGADQLIGTLGDANLQVAKLALDQLTDRCGADSLPQIRAAIGSAQGQQLSMLLWALHRLGALSDPQLAAAAKSDDMAVRSHAMRIVAESAAASAPRLKVAIDGLRDANARVQRVAADAVGRHEDFASVGTLLARLETVEDDPYLERSLQIALRNLLRRDGAFDVAAVKNASKRRTQLLAHVCLAVPTEPAGQFLMQAAKREWLPSGKRVAMLSHIASHVPAEQVDELIALVRSQQATPAFQELLLLAVETKLAARGAKPSAAVKQWASELATAWLDQGLQNRDGWRVVRGDACWDIETRNCEDGKRNVAFLSSLPGGERARSVIRSHEFVLPKTLTFYLCGHRGVPGKPAENTTYVTLRAANGNELARAVPPRNDVAKKVEWSLPDQAGKRAYIEVVDQNEGGAYAWLAVSRFEPKVVSIPQSGRRERLRRIQSAAKVAAAFGLADLNEPLRSVVRNASSSPSARIESAKALARLRNDGVGQAVVQIAALPGTSPAWRNRHLLALADDDADYDKLLADWMKHATHVQQRSSAIAMTASRPAAAMLLALVERGVASARLLQERAVAQRLIITDARNESRIEELTAGLPPLELAVQAKIRSLTTTVRGQQGKLDLARGRKLFEKNCQICHQVAGKGALVGPQLDGIGNRGLARVLEDLLDPNRNVDSQFRATTIALADGRVLTGLQRRKEGKLVVFADQKGKEFSVKEDDIEQLRRSVNSLMPTNLTDTLKPGELMDLVGYLTSLRK